MEVETPRMHGYFDDQSKIRCCVQPDQRSIVARSTSLHVSASRPKFGSSHHQRQSRSISLGDEFGTPQCLEAYWSLISLSSGFHDQSEARLGECFFSRQCYGQDVQVCFGQTVLVHSVENGRSYVFDPNDSGIEMISARPTKVYHLFVVSVIF